MDFSSDYFIRRDSELFEIFKLKMKVDMSPKAVKERLKTVDELWLLSVKLMNSKKVKPEKDTKNELPDNTRDSRFAREKS